MPFVLQAEALQSTPYVPIKWFLINFCCVYLNYGLVLMNVLSGTESASS